MKRISLARALAVVLFLAVVFIVGGSVYLRSRSSYPGWGDPRSKVSLLEPDVVTFRSRGKVHLRISDEAPSRGATPLVQRLAFLPNTGPVRDQADATTRAIQLANDAAQQQFSVAPFEKTSQKAEFDGQRWTWHRRIACGMGDLEADVAIAPNGTVEEVNIRLLMDQARAF